MNLKGFQGKVTKTATIHSDDPQSPELTLKVEAMVVALVEVKPSTTVIFRGMADRIPETVLDLVGPAVTFHPKDLESDLNENIGYSLETVEDGKHYRLRISNKTKRGNYRGYIKVNTDLPQKPDLIVRVNGFIEGEISVKPAAVLIGKLAGDQPERPGKVMVTTNRDSHFEITKLVYDEQLMSATKHETEDGHGYIIELNPILSAIPAGSRKQTTLTIETSVAPGEQETVQVHLFNSAARPTAKPPSQENVGK